MSGVIVGVDYAQALLVARRGARRPFLELLKIAERGLLAGVAKNRE